jgi:hypothetical protein
MTNLAPQEIYLLETFISPEYFAELRDTWGDMIKHVEHCLDQFMLNIPPDYRNRPLPEQPDVVWGERILPNFRATFQDLISAFIVLTHGDQKALRAANGPFNDYKGQREYSTDWMKETDANHYFDLLNKANTIAGNICATEEPYWQPGDLLDHVGDRGPIVIPVTLPKYRLNSKTTVRTGEHVKQPGIYLPDLDASCAQFLSPGSDAPSAIVLQSMKELRHPDTGATYGEEPIFEDKPCLWTLVERTGNMPNIRAPESLLESANHRTPGGSVCPAAGYYFTPAKEGSRRRFQQGEIMPDLDSLYGATIWQWDQNQA